MRWLLCRSSLRRSRVGWLPWRRFFELALDLRDLAFERLQLIHRAAQPAGQIAADPDAERDIADDARNLHHVARQRVTQAAMLLGLHLPRDGLQLLPMLLGLLVKFFDFVDLGQQIVVLDGEIFVGDHEFRQHQHVLDGIHAVPQVIAQLDDFADHQRRAGKRLANRPLPALVALG